MINILVYSSRNLSRRLSSLREHRSSISSSDAPKRVRTTPGGSENNVQLNEIDSPFHSTDGATEKRTIEEQLRKRNAYLQGRVDTLQEQNMKLGSCITELKSFTDIVSVYLEFNIIVSVYLEFNIIVSVYLEFNTPVLCMTQWFSV